MSVSLAAERYINLKSFKRDGSPVCTPVWVAPLGDELVIFTDGTSYKVKRIGRNATVEVAACDGVGKLRGPWHPGEAEISDDPGFDARAYEALSKKYGLQMRVLNFMSRLGGRMKRRKVIRVRMQAQG